MRVPRDEARRKVDSVSQWAEDASSGLNCHGRGEIRTRSKVLEFY